jgi:hypothetical protein
LANLYIFGDESGTMPVNDSDKPFVAATIATVDNPPALIGGSDNDEKMVEIFKNLNLVPFAAIVKPFPGYAKILKAKYNKIQVMARATRLVTGASVQYLDEKTLTDGFDLRNTVWGYAMLQAIANAVLNTLFTSTIDAVQVILDSKTMTPSMRFFFKEMIINRIGVGTRQFLRSFLPMNPSVVSEWGDHVRFSAETTSFSWSDNSEEFEQQFGLRLADRFARKIYQAQITRQPGIEAMLKNAGFEDFIVDISELVTRLDQRVVDNFRRNTGLPEPREL